MKEKKKGYTFLLILTIIFTRRNNMCDKKKADSIEFCGKIIYEALVNIWRIYCLNIV